MTEKHLRIFMITNEEIKYIDNALGLKEVMPDGSMFVNDPLARLHAVGFCSCLKRGWGAL